MNPICTQLQTCKLRSLVVCKEERAVCKLANCELSLFAKRGCLQGTCKLRTCCCLQTGRPQFANLQIANSRCLQTSSAFANMQMTTICPCKPANSEVSLLASKICLCKLCKLRIVLFASKLANLRKRSSFVLAMLLCCLHERIVTSQFRCQPQKTSSEGDTSPQADRSAGCWGS